MVLLLLVVVCRPLDHTLVAVVMVVLVWFVDLLMAEVICCRLVLPRFPLLWLSLLLVLTFLPRNHNADIELFFGRLDISLSSLSPSYSLPSLLSLLHSLIMGYILILWETDWCVASGFWSSVWSWLQSLSSSLLLLSRMRSCKPGNVLLLSSSLSLMLLLSLSVWYHRCYSFPP